jgi:predicted nucleic acid-binding protein
VSIQSVDNDLVREAADIKADFAVSYAAAFCIATARRSDAEILTNDPEFKSVQHLVKVKWIVGGRSQPRPKAE